MKTNDQHRTNCSQKLQRRRERVNERYRTEEQENTNCEKRTDSYELQLWDKRSRGSQSQPVYGCQPTRIEHMKERMKNSKKINRNMNENRNGEAAESVE